MATLRFRVAEEQSGSRLDRVLAGRPEIASRADAERLLETGAVAVDGVARQKSHRLSTGQEVAVELVEARPLEPADVRLSVLWQDEHLLVVEKPAGMVVHPAGRTREGTLVHGLLGLGAAGGPDERPGIVHRLDRDTSGLLVVARSPRVHGQLTRLVRRREVDRRYLALVRGRPRSRSGRIQAPIGRDRRDRTRMSLDTPTPRDAVTWFELQEQLPAHALLEVRLETGRTHQIRVHLAAIDLPIAGDPVYGVGGDLGLTRQFLHAHRLRFRHPITGEDVDVSSPLPPDLVLALASARG
ncbi:MAG: RluA family pseudouridine synthase [Thermoleophilia bacterium]|nr:RluA family pseudouridine synthase [Thermoleophilia bacterium]